MLHNSAYTSSRDTIKKFTHRFSNSSRFVTTNYPSIRNSYNKSDNRGVQEAKNEMVKIEKVNHDRFRNLVQASNQCLLRISNVFPFDLFTDEISIEIAQVSVIKRYFFATAHLQTIPIKNVADIFLDTSLFFAAIKIIDSSYIENSIQVEYLKKSDASKARRIIQGLVTANKAGIDLTKVSPDILVKEVEALGRAQQVEIR